MRVVFLENQFNSIHLHNFPNVSSYCQKLKELKDQRTNVDRIVDEHAVVIRLVVGLLESDYDSVAQAISHKAAKDNATSFMALYTTQQPNNNTASLDPPPQQQSCMWKSK